MIGMLPLLRLDLGTSMAPVVCCQDAAGPVPESRHRRTGAFCLGIGVPPLREIQAVGDRCEVRGKVHVHATWSPMLELDDKTANCALRRTVLPYRWFTTDTHWELLLARKWKHVMHINQGEARAATLYSELLARLPQSGRVDYLDVSDNMVAVGVLSRGRAAPLGP